MVGYGVSEATSKVCKQDHGKYDEVDAGTITLPAFTLAPDQLKGDRSYYGVRIVTGKQHGAGTDDTGVYVTLVGSKASSGKVYISSWLKSFQRLTSTQTYDDLVIETDKDLGEVLVVVLGNDENWLSAGKDAPWYIDYVDVHNLQSKESAEFPCYHWIGDGDYVSITAHTTTLQDMKGNEVLLQQRQSQLDQRKALYQWQKFPETGLPSGIDDTVKKLPADEQFGTAKSIDFTTDALKGTVALGVESLPVKLDNLRDFEKLADTLGKGELPVYQAGRWTTDEEYGRQILNAVNPVVISQCTSLPANFPVTNDMVKGSLNRGLSLEGEIKAGHVYICDLKVMDGLPCREDYYCPAPICLLYVNGNDQLVPIAIQLEQTPGPDNPIFLPSDNWIDWLLAKIHYQSAHAQHHELSSHYLSCHAAMETYGVGTMRNLPDPHPVFKLLRPHVHYTMAINTRARATLINDGGIIDQFFAIGGKGKVQLMQRAGTAYSVHWTNIKRNLKKRGVENPLQLPGYYYRDDGLQVWQKIEDYVREIITEFYSSDTDVAEDQELKAWAEDIHTNGFPGYNGAAPGHDFPKHITTKDELVEVCTLIMFTGSAQHAAVNFAQYNYYQYVPNAPFGMRRPPLRKKGVADYQDLLDAMPDKDTTTRSISTTYLLSQYSSDEIFLGVYPAKRFTEERAQRMIERFQKALDGVSGDILERNKMLDMPYTYLLQKKVPNSITI